jgi:hypothetical protein
MLEAVQSTHRHDSAASRRKLVAFGIFALALACVLMVSLLTARPASAASRGFKVHNNSTHTLRLEAARRVPAYKCIQPITCVPTHHPMDFEGRPEDGSLLHPGHVQTWELKYGFSFTGGVQYAANLWYKVVGTSDEVEYTIEVYSTSNESACAVRGPQHLKCTAEGTKLTFGHH